MDLSPTGCGVIDVLLTAWLLLAFGAPPVAGWRLAQLPPERRRIWALTGLPLLVSGALAGLVLLSRHTDAALSQGLGVSGYSPLTRALLLLLGAEMLALLGAALAGARLEAAGWRLLAGFALLATLGIAFSAEALRIGEAQAGPIWGVLALVGCRSLIALGAGESLAPGRPGLAPLAAALAVATYLLFLPRPLPKAILAAQGAFPFAAAALLFASARWLPERLRRPALLAATLLAGLALALAASVSQALAPMRFD